MAAKNYDIVCGWMNAYIAKHTKSKIMSTDRRPISGEEIMMLIDFALKKYLSDNDMVKGGFEFQSQWKDGYKVKVELVKD
uniref:hypothetical protein n=1 Tax=Candidatus Cryptobacteroides bacterium TaxID=3085639 RepID=UPI004029FC74